MAAWAPHLGDRVVWLRSFYGIPCICVRCARLVNHCKLVVNATDAEDILRNPCDDLTDDVMRRLIALINRTRRQLTTTNTRKNNKPTARVRDRPTFPPLRLENVIPLEKKTTKRKRLE
jgi:hypothetical protein